MLIYIEGNIGTGKTTFLNRLQYYLYWFEYINYDARILLEPVDEWENTKDSDGKNILEKFYGDQGKYSYLFQMNSFISRVKKIVDEFERDDAKFTVEYTDNHENDDNHETIKPSPTETSDSQANDSQANDSWGDFESDSESDDEMPGLMDDNKRMDKLLFVERSIYTDKNCFAENCYETGKMSKLEYDVYCRWNEWLSSEFNVRPDAYIYLRCYPNVNHDRIQKRNRSGEEGIPIDYLETLHEKHDKWMAKEKETIPVLTIDALQDFKDPEVMAKIAEEIYYFVK
jgi:deoxyadenosine/deoxycytidine kinase